MTLYEPKKIDMIGTRDGKIIMDILDTGKFKDDKRRDDFLMEKLSHYLFFIMGEMKKRFPDHSPKDVIIHIASVFEPTKVMKEMNYISPKQDRTIKIPVVFEKFQFSANAS